MSSKKTSTEKQESPKMTFFHPAVGVQDLLDWKQARDEERAEGRKIEPLHLGKMFTDRVTKKELTDEAALAYLNRLKAKGEKWIVSCGQKGPDGFCPGHTEEDPEVKEDIEEMRTLED
jgi:hypothetical protein